MESHGGKPPDGLRRHHWIHWLLTLAAVVAAGVYLLPCLRSHPESFHSFFRGLYDWQRVSFNFLACALFTYATFSLLSPHLCHLRQVRTQPPTWFAFLLGAFVVALLDLTFGLSRHGYTASIWEWIGYAGGSIALAAFVRRLFAFEKAPLSARPTNGVGDATHLPSDWASFEDWLRIDAPARYDLLGSRAVATRVQERLVSGTRSVGIIGPFGIGKTSIVSWVLEIVKADTRAKVPSLLFSQHSCWGFETSASAIHTMLEEAINQVERYTDTYPVKSLPESYRQMFSAGGQWLDNVSKLFFRQGDPLPEREGETRAHFCGSSLRYESSFGSPLARISGRSWPNR